MTEIAPEPVATSKRLRTGMASYERVKMAIPSSPSLDVLSPALLAESEADLEPLKNLLALGESSSALADKIFKYVTYPQFLGLLLQALAMDKPAAIHLLNWKTFLRHTTTHFLAGIADWNVSDENLTLLQTQIIPGNKPDTQARAALHLLLLSGRTNLTQEQMLFGAQALVRLLADRVARQPILDIEYAQAAHLLLYYLVHTNTAASFLQMPFATRILAAGLDLGLLARFACLLLARKTFYLPYAPRTPLSAIVLRLLRQTASPVSHVAKLASKVLLSAGLDSVSLECLIESGVAPLLNLMSKGRGYGPGVAPLIQTLRNKVAAELPQVAYYLTQQGTPLQKRAAITLLAQPRNVVPPPEAYEIVLKTAFEDDVCFDALLVLTARTEMHRRSGFVPSVPSVASPQHHAEEVCMSHLLFSDRFSDVKFVLDDGSEVPAHKAVLCSQPYFDRMLTGGFREANVNTHASLPVPDTPANTFRLVLAAVYGKPTRDLAFGSVQEALALLVALDRYQISKGCAECVKYLGEHLNEQCIEQLIHVSLTIPAAESLFGFCLLWLLDAKNLVSAMPLLRELFNNEGNRIRQFFLQLMQASVAADSSPSSTNAW